jgi:malate permease and related proteins
MNTLLSILLNNIIPIFILIIFGFIIGKKFDLNILTLTKLVFYIFTPGYIFVNLYTTGLDFDHLNVLLFCIIYLIINDVLARFISKVRKYDIGMENALKNSIMFNNTGNIGLSLITLVFSSTPFVINGHTPYLDRAISTQIIILVFMNLTTNTFGFYNASRAGRSLKTSIGQIFLMPPIYVIPSAFLFKYLKIDLTAIPLWPALEYIKNGLVPMALLTLGVQLSKTRFDFKDVNVSIAVIIRLVLGPILAFLLIYLFRFHGVIAQTVLISYSVPTAVNTALIAVECNNNQSFASQVVMMSTVFSAATLSAAIFAARILFPV